VRHTTATRACSFSIPSVVKFDVRKSYWSLAYYHGYRLHQSPFYFQFLTAPAFWTALKLRAPGARFTTRLHPVSTSLYTVHSATPNYPHIPTETLPSSYSLHVWVKPERFHFVSKVLRRVRSPDKGKAVPIHVRKRHFVLKLFNLYKAAVKNRTRAIIQFIFLSVHNVIRNKTFQT